MSRLKYHLNRINLPHIKSLLPEFLEKIMLKQGRPHCWTLKESLDGGWLVALAVNSRTLNEKPGFKRARDCGVRF